MRAARQLLLPGPAPLDGSSAFPGRHSACNSAAHQPSTFIGTCSAFCSRSSTGISVPASVLPNSNQPKCRHQIEGSQESNTLAVPGTSLQSTGPFSPLQQKPWPLPSHSCGWASDPRRTTGAPPECRATPFHPQQGRGTHGSTPAFQDASGVPSGVPYLGGAHSQRPFLGGGCWGGVSHLGTSTTGSGSLPEPGINGLGSEGPGSNGPGSMGPEFGSVLGRPQWFGANSTVTGSQVDCGGVPGGRQWLGANSTATGSLAGSDGPGSGGVPGRRQWQRHMSMTESADAGVEAKKVRDSSDLACSFEDGYDGMTHSTAWHRVPSLLVLGPARYLSEKGEGLFRFCSQL